MRCIVFLSILLNGLIASAQTKKFEIGFEAGPNMMIRPTMIKLSNAFSEYGKYQPTTGLNVTPFFEYSFHDRVSLRVGIGFQRVRQYYLNRPLYEPISSEYPYTMMVTSYFDSKSSVNSLTIPVTMSAFLGSKKQLYFRLGTNMTIHTTQTAEFNVLYAPAYQANQNMFQNRKEGAFDVAFGLLTGFGVKVPVNKFINFSTEIRNDLTLIQMSHLSFKYYKYKETIYLTPSLLFGFSYHFK